MSELAPLLQLSTQGQRRGERFLTGGQTHKQTLDSDLKKTENETGRQFRRQMVHLFDVLTTEGYIHKTQSFGC